MLLFESISTGVLEPLRCLPPSRGDETPFARMLYNFCNACHESSIGSEPFDPVGLEPKVNIVISWEQVLIECVLYCKILMVLHFSS